MPTRKSILSQLVKSGWLRSKDHPKYEVYSVKITIRKLLGV